MNTNLEIRRNFFDLYRQRISEQQSKSFVGENRFSCPCCGYPTLDERGGYDICQICWWEDDGQDDLDAEKVRGGPNHHYSLAEARKNFEKYLVMYPPENDTRISGADSEKVRDFKRSLIGAFDEIMKEPVFKDLNDLWLKVKNIENALEQDLKESIEAYEAKIKTERR